MQIDGCANCGFGYASNHFDDPESGVQAWLSYGKYILSLSTNSDLVTDEEYENSIKRFDQLPDEEVRRMVFEWFERQEREPDVETTVFVYDEEYVAAHRSLGLPVFKTMGT